MNCRPIVTDSTPPDEIRRRVERHWFLHGTPPVLSLRGYAQSPGPGWEEAVLLEAAGQLRLLP